MRSVLIADPVLEPVSLAEAKLHLRVDLSNEDALIAGLIVTARELCELRTRRSFIEQTWEGRLDCFPSESVGYWSRANRYFGPGDARYWPGSRTGTIVFDHPPLISVESIQYVDANGATQTLATSEYDVSAGTPGRARPKALKQWPGTRAGRMDAVIVTYKAGYSEDPILVPASIRSAMLLTIGHLYLNREDVVPGARAELPIGAARLLDCVWW